MRAEITRCCSNLQPGVWFSWVRSKSLARISGGKYPSVNTCPQLSHRSQFITGGITGLYSACFEQSPLRSVFIARPWHNGQESNRTRDCMRTILFDARYIQTQGPKPQLRVFGYEEINPLVRTCDFERLKNNRQPRWLSQKTQRT